MSVKALKGMQNSILTSELASAFLNPPPDSHRNLVLLPSHQRSSAGWYQLITKQQTHITITAMRVPADVGNIGSRIAVELLRNRCKVDIGRKLDLSQVDLEQLLSSLGLHRDNS